MEKREMRIYNKRMAAKVKGNVYKRESDESVEGNTGPAYGCSICLLPVFVIES